MGLKSLPIGKFEYEQFHGLQKRKHKGGWWAVFSVNKREEVWPFVCYGLTPKEKRELVPLERHPLLSVVAGIIKERTDEVGGRFFINRHGVFGIKGDDENCGVSPEQFIEWRPDEPLTDKAREPTPPSAEEMRAEYERMVAKIAARRSMRRTRV